MPTKQDLYLAMGGVANAAGPVAVVAVYFQRPIHNWYLQSKWRGLGQKSHTFDSLWLELSLQQLIDERAVLVLSATLHPFRFRSQLPSQSMLRPKVDLLVGEFYRYGGQRPHCHYFGKDLPATPREEGTRWHATNCPFGCFLARRYAEAEHRSLMRDYYHRLYPQYRWDQNKGMRTPGHLYRILKNGPVYNVHREEYLYRIARHWWSRIEQWDWDAMTVKVPPPWWGRWFPDADFLHSLPKEKQTEAQAFLTKPADPGFRTWCVLNKPRILHRKEPPRKRKPQQHKPSRKITGQRQGRFVRDHLRQYLRRKHRFYQSRYDYLCQRPPPDANG